ncbi:hypothetical protein CEXT_726771 [Caerostris extrusa]|uniref:Uncharacterized protein n=1 Tax=Caerostris extrusa TaxID=172846 RepID=A0AAV4SU25_CAEEX|nr:hypothetical protein CEXT_726771 [Caerostris extrusa]
MHRKFNVIVSNLTYLKIIKYVEKQSLIKDEIKTPYSFFQRNTRIAADPLFGRKHMDQSPVSTNRPCQYSSFVRLPPSQQQKGQKCFQDSKFWSLPCFC